MRNRESRSAYVPVPAIEQAQTGLVNPLPDHLRPTIFDVALPVPAKNAVFVPTRPLFVDKLPVIERILGIPFGLSTQKKREEMVLIGKPERHEVADPSYAVKISVGMPYGHNRSFEYLDRTDTEAKSIIVGGREYASLSTKGGDFGYPQIIWGENMRANALLYGMMTKAHAKKAVDVSEWFRNNGIEAEVVVGVSELELLPWIREILHTDPRTGHITLGATYDLVDPDTFKVNLITRALDYNMNPHTTADKMLKLPEVQAYLDEVDFVVLNRVMNVPFRFSDIYKAFGFRTGIEGERDMQKEFSYMMNYIFSYLNRSRSPGEQIAYLQNPSNDVYRQDWTESLSTYWDYATDKLARQTGALHKQGILHGWLHMGNVVADGSFCDLDSVEGPPFGQEPLSAFYAAMDLVYAASSVDIVTQQFGHRKWLTKRRKDILKGFVRKYIKSRWGMKPDQDALDELLGEVQHFRDQYSPQLITWIQQELHMAGSQ